jgi:hypothetical protein
MIHLSRFAGILAAIFVLAVPRTYAAPYDDLAGVYRCEGTNPDGKPYRGTVEIVKNDQTYRVKWSMGQRSASFGIGVVRGDMLAVSYYTGGNLGVVVYRIAKGPQLIGEWTVLGADGQLFPEKLTKMGVLADAAPEGGQFDTAGDRAPDLRLAAALAAR